MNPWECLYTYIPYEIVRVKLRHVSPVRHLQLNNFPILENVKECLWSRIKVPLQVFPARQATKLLLINLYKPQRWGLVGQRQNHLSSKQMYPIWKIADVAENKRGGCKWSGAYFRFAWTHHTPINPFRPRQPPGACRKTTERLDIDLLSSQWIFNFLAARGIENF